MRLPLFPLLALALLAACSSAPEPPLPPLRPDAVILAFGDSLTHGTGARPEESYPAVLAELSGRRVVNAGVPGERSAQGLARLPEVLAQARPDLLILCHGGNDLLRRGDEAALAENLRAMVRLARESGVATVLVGVPRPRLVLLESAPLYREVAQELDVPLLEEALPAIESDRSLKSDAIHPNAAGYRRLAESIHLLLRERGALP